MKYEAKEYRNFIGSDFFNIGPTVSFMWKNDDVWSIEAVSKNVESNFGYSVTDFLNNDVIYSELIHKDDLTQVFNEVQEACRSKEVSFIHKPYRIKNSSGEYRWVKDSTTILYNLNGDIIYFVGYIIDITDNEINMRKAQEHEEKLKTAQSLASIGNWELNLITNELYWSDEIFKLFGIDNSTKISYGAFLSAIHPDDRDLVNKSYLHSLKTKEKYTIQHRLLLPDNSIKYVEEKCESYFDEYGQPYKSFGTVQDITKQKETEIELKKTLSFFKSHQLAMDESSIVSKSDLNGVITYVNNNFCKLTGYSKEEVIGKPHSILRHPSNSKKMFKELWDTIYSKKVWKKVIKNRNKFGDTYWVDTNILPILDENSKIVEFIAVRHDVTAMIKQQKKLDSIANTDTLTGLGNRYKLLNDIKSSTSPALAIINLDKFSHINDFYGHEFGDFVIKEFGKKILQNRANKSYYIYHLQGDEYVVFNKNVTREDFLNKIILINEKLNMVKIEVNNEELSLNFSIAVSFESIDRILPSADMALKIAKRDNKDLIIYEDNISLNEEYANNIKWAKIIKNAILNDNVTPVFQPIVDNNSGKWSKYESLVRLRHKSKLISPYFFLDISKKSKQYTNITKTMILKSFEMFKDRDLEFSVNLTIEDILDSDIKNYIFDMLREYDIGDRVVFEIVESESINNFDKVFDFLDRVKSYGCQIAIDDFGTGYSNFEYLMKLKADYIKIDGSLIRDIDRNSNAKLVVSTIVTFAKNMNMKTIAEFVESESILKVVKELGIDYSQGYYFSEPKEIIREK